MPAPIKRNKNIVLLSRDHHDSLLLVWKIRQGIRTGIEPVRITTYLLSAFDKQLQTHFIEEESLLFNQVPSTDQLMIRAKDEHAAIRKWIELFRTQEAAANEDLLNFASLLEQHIRFEERTLFPYLEQNISPEALVEIGKELEKDRAVREHFTWNDEFWLKQ